MILSALKVHEISRELTSRGGKALIENLCARDLKNPEGIDIDLRLGSVERIVGGSLLSADETGGKRYSPKTEVVGDLNIDGHKRITIKPGEYYLVKTVEVINCPGEKVKYASDQQERFVIPDIRPRVSLQLGGVSLHCSTTNPGYSGPLKFGMANLGPSDFEIELGARAFKIYWHTVDGEISRSYEGQHQGERTTSQGSSEKQV